MTDAVELWMTAACAGDAEAALADEVKLGPRVARRQGNTRAALTLSLAGAFLDLVATSGDHTFLPMAAPRSARAASQPPHP